MRSQHLDADARNV